MSDGNQYNVIWLIVGVLLSFYGILIVGAGLYYFAYPPERVVVLSYLHPELWWGGLMIVVGALFCHGHFRRGR